MKKMFPQLLGFAICFLIISSSIKAQVYVNASATGTNDGTSWTDAYTDLQDALTDTNNSGGIWVAAGTYYPSIAFDFDNSSTTEAREVTFQIPDGVEVYGGFSGTETAIEDRVDFGVGETNETILGGNIGATGDATDNVYHIIYTKNVSSSTVVDGFTIRDGNADTGSFAFTNNKRGAGWYNDGNGTGNSSNPTLRNCSFLENYADANGAAMFNDASDGGTANLNITNCNFIDNISDSNGGAMYNEAEFGGTFNSTFTNCTFNNNYSDFAGGAMYNSGVSDGTASPTFIGCSFISNTARALGGGLYNNGLQGNSNPIFNNCNFTENNITSTFDSGGAIYNHGQEGNASPIITNCIFVRNEAPNGAAIANDGEVGSDGPGTSSPIITNCTFIGISTTGSTIYNIAIGLLGVQGEAKPVIRNCIFGGNTGSVPSWDNFDDVNATTDIAFSIIPEADEATITSGDYEGTTVGAGMIYGTDPLFVDPLTDDFSLQLGSPAIDAGNNDAISNSISTDAAGDPRIISETIDLGAFENQDIPFVITVKTDNTGSSNDDQFEINTGSTTNTFDLYWEEIGDPTNNGLEPNLTENPTITFPNPGSYEIKIVGDLQRFYIPLGANEAEKVLSIEQWGDISWTSMENAFAGCTNLISTASDSPDLSGVTSLQGMFSNTSNFNSDISDWDVSRVNNFTDMFLSASAFNNGGVALDWTTMGQSPLVSTISMSTMFNGASNFNQDVSAWDVSKVRTFQRMFLAADAFNNGGVALDWTTVGQSSNVNTINMDRTFRQAINFNQDVSAWDVSKVNSFLGMFESATAFDNGGVALDWTTVGQSPNVSTISMNAMFSSAVNFNQDVSSWTVEKVDNMNSLFSGATLFNQSLADWDITGITVPSSMENMLNNTALSTANYDATLSGWAALGDLNITDGITLGAAGLSYCSALADRAILTNAGTNNWTINDAGTGCDEPSTQASAITFSNVTSAQMDISWTEGNGSSRLVVVKAGSPVDFTPTDASSYTANANFSAGTEYGSGNYIVYNGNGNLVTLTGLTFGETYHVQIYDYNGTSGIENYNTTITSDNSANILIAPEIEVLNGAVNFAIDGEIDFGSTIENTSASQTLTINNEGTIDLTISDIQLTTGTAFSISDITLPATIPAGNTADFTITLSSASAQTWTDVLTITSDDADESTFTLNLTGEVTPAPIPELQVLNGATDLAINDDIDFGSIVENTSTSQTFTISNTGTADLNISAIELSTGTAYSISGITLPITIASGNTTDFVVTLSSATAQIWTDVLTITSDDADESPFTLSLTGEVINAPEPEIEVLNGATDLAINDEIDFGSIVENTSTSQTFTISNTGTADLNISAIELSTGTAYSISGITLPVTIASGNTTDFVVTLSSATAQTWTDVLTITSDDADESPFTLNLTGEISAADGQEITVNYNGSPLISGTGTIAFGDVTQAQEVSETFTVENTGTNDLLITEIILSDGSVFTLPELNFPITLVPGETLDLNIFLSTDNLGLFTDTITILTNDPDLSGFEVNLSGNVLPVPRPEIQVQQQTTAVSGVVEFGTAEAGENLIVAFDILNIGTANLQVSSISSSNPRFTVSSITLPTTIPASASRSFDLMMTTDQTGIYESTITVSSNDPDQSLYTFNVRGIVEGARVVVVVTNSDNSTDRIEISGEDIDLGQTQFNVNLEKQFGIENLSDSEEILVNSITSDNPLFKISNIPTSIAAGSFKEFSVTLNSKSIGINSAKITVSTSINDFSFNLIAEVISEEEPQLIIYNLITPNGDGKHDFLFIENISLFPNNTVSIFNRLGNKVFEISSYNNTTNIFEGISDNGKELITGNYYYVIDKGDGSKRISGFLLIKR